MNTNEQSDLDETRARKPAMDKSPLSNVVVFLLIFVVCFFLGNMALLLVAMMGGMDVEGASDIFSSIADPNLRPYIKAGIGLNHLIIYTGTALLFAIWAKGKKWGTLFQSNALDIMWKEALESCDESPIIDNLKNRFRTKESLTLLDNAFLQQVTCLQ